MDAHPAPARPAGKTAPRTIALFLALVIGLCLIAVATLAFRVLDTSRDLRLRMAEDSSWMVAQLEVEHQHVLLAIQDLLYRPQAQGAPLSDLRLKFDIYYSRVQTVAAHTANLQGGMLKPDEFAARLKIVRDNLDMLTPLVDGLQPGDREALGQIADLLASVMPDVRFIVVNAVLTSQSQAQMLRIQRERVLEQFLTAGALALVLILGLLAVSLHFYRQAMLHSQMVARLDSNLRASFETAIDAVIVTDAEGKILLFNSAAENLFEQLRTDVIGQGISVLIRHPSSPVDEAKLIAQLVRRRRRRLRLRSRNGRSVAISIAAVSDTGSSGSRIYVGFVRDVSTVISLERQRRLTLQRAERDAAEKVRFLAATSHELRTPMQGVVAAIDLVMRQQSDPAIHSLLHIAGESAIAALDQIDHVLDVAALDDVAQAERPDEAFSVQAIASDLIAAALRTGADEGLNIRLDVAGGLPDEITGKPRAFRQTLRNLISNAVKFGGEAPITVRLLRPGPNLLRVEVQDAGIGIDSADQARIFEDFETLDRGYARLSRGIGIGLGIVRRAVRSMRGTVGVISSPGNGSTFWFEIPIRPAPVAQAALAEIRPLRVLVVDDQSVNRLLIQKIVTVLGHRADKAGDGQTAVQMAATKGYDVILMDISMPGMDGIEATRLIRANGLSQQAQIIGFTANLQPADHSRALQAGMREILYKPVRPTDVERVLQSPRLQALPTATPSLPQGIADAVDLLGASLGLTRLRGVVQEMQASFQVVLDQASWNPSGPEPDLDALGAQAHKCAGAAAIFGALPLHRAFCGLETAALNRETSEIADHVEHCRAALSVCTVLIDNAVNELVSRNVKTG